MDGGIADEKRTRFRSFFSVNPGIWCQKMKEPQLTRTTNHIIDIVWSGIVHLYIHRLRAHTHRHFIIEHLPEALTSSIPDPSIYLLYLVLFYLSAMRICEGKNERETNTSHQREYERYETNGVGQNRF